jgi:hypothetical protein
VRAIVMGTRLTPARVLFRTNFREAYCPKPWEDLYTFTITAL